MHEMLPDLRFTSISERGEMLPSDEERARLVRKLDELQLHITAVWDASALRQRESRGRTGLYRDEKTAELQPPSQDSNTRNSLLKRLSLFVLGR